METLEHDVPLRKMAAVAGVLQPIPSHGFFRILYFAAFNVGESIIDPRFQKVETFTNYHVVIIRDRQQRIPVRKNGVEGFTNLTDFERNGVSGHAKVKVPIKVEIIIEVMPHEDRKS